MATFNAQKLSGQSAYFVFATKKCVNRFHDKNVCANSFCDKKMHKQFFATKKVCANRFCNKKNVLKNGDQQEGHPLIAWPVRIWTIEDSKKWDQKEGHPLITWTVRICTSKDSKKGDQKEGHPLISWPVRIPKNWDGLEGGSKKVKKKWIFPDGPETSQCNFKGYT